MEYRIPEENMADLEGKVAKLNKTATKLDCAPVTVTKVRDDVVTVVYRTDTFGHNGHEVEMPADYEVQDVRTERVVGQRTYHVVTVAGEAPKLNGWSFIATLQPVEIDGETMNVMRTVPGESVPTEYRDRGNVCDHCGYDRRRNETFVVRHEDGSHKQVGRQCLKDFLGHKSPEAVARWCEYLADLDDTMRGFGGMGRTVETFDVKSYLEFVDAATRAYGWRSKKTAWEYGGEATAVTAFSVMTDVVHGDNRTKDPAYNYAEVMEALPTVNVARIEAAIEWAKNLESTEDNDYLWNLKVTCGKARFTRKESGIIASVLSAYDRHVMHVERERQQAEAGPVAEGKVTIVGIVIKEDWRESDWGTQHKMTVRTENGSCVWSTVPKAIEAQIAQQGVALVGSRVRFNATVTKSGNSETFGFASRPSKASVEEGSRV